MRKIIGFMVGSIVLVMSVAFLFSAPPLGNAPAKTPDKVLNVEMWELILGSCERVVLNDDYQSGLVRCYYLDPTQKYGVGAITSAFYKDGSEHTYWKGWALHTDKAQVAQLLDNGQWHVTSPNKMVHNMGYLSAMRTFFEKAKSDKDWKLTVKKLTSYLSDKYGNPMMDKPSTVYLNKNSAKDPNPTD